MNINMIHCGDAAATMKTLPGSSVDLIVTDPPYLVRYRDRSGRTLANDDKPDAVLSSYAEMFRVLKSGRYCITFCGWTAIDRFAGAWTGAGFRTVGRIVWSKGYASKSGHTNYRHESAFVLAKGYPRMPENPMDDVQPWEYTGNKVHPTEKAVSVIAPLIGSFSRPGDVVLDPFLGSGTTAVAAALLGRSYIGIELESRYCTLARKRLAGVAKFRRSDEASAVSPPNVGGLAA